MPRSLSVTAAPTFQHARVMMEDMHDRDGGGNAHVCDARCSFLMDVSVTCVIQVKPTRAWMTA
eukprot:3588589-Rhodomonas_salina.1